MASPQNQPHREFAHLTLVVQDDSGCPSPFRAEWGRAGRKPRRIWSTSGAEEIDIPAGPLSLLVRRGIDHSAVALELDARPGEQVARQVVLRRRFDARQWGWFGGDSHIHVMHDQANDRGLTIAHGARLAAAEGLDYVQLAYAWDCSGDWIPAAELDRQVAAASTPELTVAWNIETPKSFMGEDDGGADGNLHCFGHGWTVGLTDNSAGCRFFHTGPNFRVMSEVRRQGGIVCAAHPARFWWNRGNFVSNLNSELPFDFVAGTPYAGVDILNDSPAVFYQSERYWYALLDEGYKVAGTAASDACLERGDAPGRLRLYVQMAGAFTWAKMAAAVVAGRTVATSGPFVLWTVASQPPGAEFPADSQPRRATLRVWSGPLPGDTLTAVQLIRNGEVVRAWDLRARKIDEWRTAFDIADDEFAWYCTRVLSTGGGSQASEGRPPAAPEIAVAGPVYFLPAGFQRPAATPARVAVTVTDAASGEPVAAAVGVIDVDVEITTLQLPATGTDVLVVPATASLRFSAPGYQTAERSLYMDCPELIAFCRDTSGPLPGSFGALRNLLGNLALNVSLTRA